MATLPPASPNHLLRTHISPISSLSISPDNERIYSGDQSGLVAVTSTRSLRSIATWSAHTDSLLGIEEWNDKIITHARDNKLHIWTRVVELPASSRLGSSATQSSSDQVAPTLCYSMDVNALNYCRFSLLPHQHGEDNALIALPNLVDSTSADVWALPARDRVHAAVGQTGQKSYFNSNPSERSKTGIIMSLHLFSVDRNPPSAPSSSTLSLSELRLLCAYESGSVTLRRYTRTDKGKSVEGAGWEIIWNAKLHAETVMAMRVSRKNDLALTVSADHIIGRYDLNDPNPDSACALFRTKHPGNSSIAIRDDGRVCAMAGWDGSLRLYSTKKMKPLGTLRYHKTGCQALEFCHSMETLNFSGISENDESEEEEDTSKAEKEGRSRWLLAGGKDHRVSVWALISFEKT